MASSGFPDSPKLAELRDDQRADLKHVFESIDSNNNGKIEWGEFITAMKRVDPLISEEALQLFFSKMDINKDKAVSWEEFQYTLCECTSKVDLRECRRWSQCLVLDGDYSGDVTEIIVLRNINVSVRQSIFMNFKLYIIYKCIVLEILLQHCSSRISDATATMLQ
jgi:hypothetical protein